MASNPGGGSALPPKEGRRESSSQGPAPDGSERHATGSAAPATGPGPVRRSQGQEQAPGHQDSGEAAPPQNAGFFGFLERVLSEAKLTWHAVVLMFTSAAVICAIAYFLSRINDRSQDGFTAVITRNGVTIGFTSASVILVAIAVVARSVRKRWQAKPGRRPPRRSRAHQKPDQQAE
jgi:hypothetical protein